MKVFTQRDEERYIQRFFKGIKGRFLDIGAYDGKCFSTTHRLALQGWEGICIEPSPSVFPALERLYRNNSKIRTLEYAVADVTGKVDFYDSDGDMVSSTSMAHVKLWIEKAGCTFKKIKVNSLSVLGLFELVGYNFDFISLDVEGTNLDIFSQFPFVKLEKTKMICVEFDFQSEEMLKIAAPFGFSIFHRTAENILLTRE